MIKISFAHPMQKIQDWITQQWVILFGRKIDSKNDNWLMGPFGNLEAIDKNYIDKLAKLENLVIDTPSEMHGLIPTMSQLHFSPHEYARLSAKVIDFYERTGHYDLNVSVKWNSFFKVFGFLLKKLFSNRLNQLNIPIYDMHNSESITSEIVRLLDAKTNQIKYIFWLRKIASTGKGIYSGAYGICQLPSGRYCVKAIFPLPHGNATVIMAPKVGVNGELVLNSSGQRFGDAGFYFLLKDSKGEHWSKYIRSFRDELIISEADKQLTATQTLTLWNLNVLKFNYEIFQKQ
ncbi:hypothetical protein [Sphingobacterium anhuiense]|uniref:DUF4238 domain-containing protein n=1 Tax=Sphingobacterium anhuiense TaxID=493780 RepID=A0ABW5YSW8_9SPHI